MRALVVNGNSPEHSLLRHAGATQTLGDSSIRSSNAAATLLTSAAVIYKAPSNIGGALISPKGTCGASLESPFGIPL